MRLRVVLHVIVCAFMVSLCIVYAFMTDVHEGGPGGRPGEHPQEERADVLVEPTAVVAPEPQVIPAIKQGMSTNGRALPADIVVLLNNIISTHITDGA